MYIRHLRLAGLSYPPEVGAGSGTTDNATGSVTEGQATPTSSGNVTSGTASDAMLKAAAAASSAEPEIPAGVAGDTAKPDGQAPVATPDATGQPDSSVARGEAPPSRIETAVKNARAALTTEFETKYAWTKGIDPADAQIGIDLLADIRRDPADFAKRLMSEIGPSEPVKETPLEKFPEPSLISQDGAKAYSSDDILKILDIHEQKIMQQLKPDLEFVRTAQTSQKESAIRGQLAQQTKQALTEARKLPHFTEANEPKILEELRAIDPRVKAAVGPIGALYMAYSQFVAKSVFPSVDAAAEERVRDSYAKKANASRGQAHPSDQGGDVKTPKLNNAQDLAKHMEQLEAAGTV